MITPELIFILLISVSIIMLLLAIFNLFNFIIRNKKINKLSKEAKKKKKKRKIKKEITYVTQQKKSSSKFFFTFIVLSSLSLGGYFGIKNYFEKNLSKKDMNFVMSTYFLVNDYQANIEDAKNSNGEQNEVTKKISNISYKMSSYATEEPNELLSVEGQRLLNRYFKSISELGINTVPIYQQFYGNAELSDEYIDNVKAVKQNEKELFKYFKIDESRIKKQ